MWKTRPSVSLSLIQNQRNVALSDSHENLAEYVSSGSFRTALNFMETGSLKVLLFLNVLLKF